jgi:hypothetical protein
VQYDRLFGRWSSVYHLLLIHFAVKEIDYGCSYAIAEADGCSRGRVLEDRG